MAHPPPGRPRRPLRRRGSARGVSESGAGPPSACTRPDRVAITARRSVRLEPATRAWQRRTTPVAWALVQVSHAGSARCSPAKRCTRHHRGRAAHARPKRRATPFSPSWSRRMAHRQSGTLAQEASSLVVVPIKLSTRVHHLLKAVLRLEGSTLPASCAAQAEATMARASRRTLESAEPTLPASPSPAVLVPGQTSRMPTGRSMHWCVVCGNLWRSRKAQPVHGGHRRCHALSWRTGKHPGIETPSGDGASEALTLSASRSAQTGSSGGMSGWPLAASYGRARSFPRTMVPHVARQALTPIQGRCPGSGPPAAPRPRGSPHSPARC